MLHFAQPLTCPSQTCFCSLTRVGVMVLVCHESNDIFLEAAKVSFLVCVLVVVNGLTGGLRLSGSRRWL